MDYLKTHIPLCNILMTLLVKLVFIHLSIWNHFDKVQNVKIKKFHKQV